MTITDIAKARMNPAQAAIWEHIEKLDHLLPQFEPDSPWKFRHYYEARSDIYSAQEQLGRAMDMAWAPDTTGDGVRREHNWFTAWWPVEKWITEEASGTGSARVLACCYIARALDILVDHDEIAGGVLDSKRSAMLKTMLADQPPAGELPTWFWRIFTQYRKALQRELELQGRAA